MLAQLPTTTAGELGTLVTGLAALVVIVVGLLTIAVLTKQLFWPARTPNQEAATKGELEQVAARLKELDDYAHNRFHDFGNALQAVRLKMETVRSEIRKDLEQVLALLTAKVDRATLTLARVEAILEGRGRPGRSPVADPEPQEENQS
jgi:hypothetical protein